MKNFIFIAFLVPPSLADRRSYQVFLGVICHKTINYRYYKYFVVTFVSQLQSLMHRNQIKKDNKRVGIFVSKEYC